jgi:hypothetical protein
LADMNQCKASGLRSGVDGVADPSLSATHSRRSRQILVTVII